MVTNDSLTSVKHNFIFAAKLYSSNTNQRGQLEAQASIFIENLLSCLCMEENLNSDSGESLLYLSCLKVIPVRWTHNSAAILRCWLLLLPLNLSLNFSKSSRNELQHLEMPKYIPLKTQGHPQSHVFFMFLILFSTRLSAVRADSIKCGWAHPCRTTCCLGQKRH